MSMNWPEVFVVGSLWFWLLLIAETILLLILLEWEQGTVATLSLVATLLALQFLSDLNLAGHAIHYPWTVVLGILGYFAVGTGWTIVKWWFYVREQRADYDELRAAFLRVQGYERDSPMPENLRSQWQWCLASARKERRRLDVHPLAAGHKAQIVRWMSYWPWSATWTLLKDPVRKAFLSIYHQIADYLQEISDKAFRGVEADLPPDEQSAAAPRTDPILAEFGIDAEALWAKTTAEASAPK
jgi:hypothetical protein